SDSETPQSPFSACRKSPKKKYSKIQLVSRLPPFANRSVLTDPPSVAASASVRCAAKTLQFFL
ncbi:MAG: hypothetical protein SPJ55_10100, partial [Treponema sp.]|nr:hypothetical protein [Treponema sp.]